jgi:hypothetical protein
MRWRSDWTGWSVGGRCTELSTCGTGHMCRMCICTLFIPSGWGDVHCWAAQAGTKMPTREGERAVIWEHSGGVNAPARSRLWGVIVHSPMWSARQWDSPHEVHNIISNVSDHGCRGGPRDTIWTRGIVDTSLGEDCGRKLAR